MCFRVGLRYKTRNLALGHLIAVRLWTSSRETWQVGVWFAFLVFFQTEFTSGKRS